MPREPVKTGGPRAERRSAKGQLDHMNFIVWGGKQALSLDLSDFTEKLDTGWFG